MDDDILAQALAWAQAQYPEAGGARQAAFANSVAYLVNAGVSGGYGGPSIREHAVSLALSLAEDGSVTLVKTISGKLPLIMQDTRMPQAGEFDFEEAMAFCEEICFGPITKLHRRAAQIMGPHFDDADDDLEALALEGTL